MAVAVVLDFPEGTQQPYEAGRLAAGTRQT